MIEIIGLILWNIVSVILIFWGSVFYSVFRTAEKFDNPIDDIEYQKELNKYAGMVGLGIILWALNLITIIMFLIK